MPTLTAATGAGSVGAALSAVSPLDPQAANANDATARIEASFTPFNTEGSSLKNTATFAISKESVRCVTFKCSFGVRVVTTETKPLC